MPQKLPGISISLTAEEFSAMYALAFLSLLACASAAPHYGPHHRHHHHHDDFAMNSFYGDSVFDTKQFWAELSKEMSKFDEMMKDFMTHFPRSSSTAGIKDNQFIITIALNGFEEKDIVVKAREGLVMVQAVQKTGDANGRSYMDVRSLPDSVNPAGSWIYEQGVLKMMFPLKKESTTEITAVPNTTEVIATETPKDREEIESQEGNNDMDADVGLEGGDAELLTNEISRQNPVEAVEATTYAIDARSKFDFVPVGY